MAKKVDLGPTIIVNRWIKSLRKNKGWSQKQVAIKSGYSDDTISHIERGIQAVSILQLLTLADILDGDPMEIMKRAKVQYEKSKRIKS